MLAYLFISLRRRHNDTCYIQNTSRKISLKGHSSKESEKKGGGGNVGFNLRDRVIE